MQEILAFLIRGTNHDFDVPCGGEDGELILLRRGRGAGAAVMRATSSTRTPTTTMAGPAALVMVMVVRPRGGNGRWWPRIWQRREGHGTVGNDRLWMGDH